MPMTIGDLRKLLRSLTLQKVPSDTLLVLAKDAEGNDFSPVEESQVSFYLSTSPYSGELVEDGDDTFNPKATPPNGTVLALVFWPVN